MRPPIRRCTTCNTKTHHNKWQYGQICPSCGLAAPFVEGRHGGLTWRELEMLKQKEIVVRNPRGSKER